MNNFVFKACQNSIVTLQLLPDSITNESRSEVIDPAHAKFRCNKARVIDIVNCDSDKPMSSDISFRDETFVYQTNEIVSVSDFDIDGEVICGEGIHYFKTKEAAVSHYHDWYEDDWKDGTYN